MRQSKENSTNSPNMPTTLTGYRLNYCHFYLQYIAGGALHTHIMNPEQACEIFEQLGIIEGYQTTEKGLVVLWETMGAIPGPDGEPMEIIGYDGCSFEEWASTYRMSEKEAQYVANYIEQQKSLQKWADEMRSIPSLIKSFNA